MPVHKRFLKILILVILLQLLSTACKLFQSRADTDSTSPIRAAGSAGQTRKNPIPMGTQISVPGWDVEVREFLRGEDALQVINTADWSAPAPPEGQEYVLAKVFIRSTSTAEDYQDLGISEMFITGENCTQHGDSMDGWPQPEFLFEDIYTAETVEGWIDAVVPVEERNLELVLDLNDYETRTTRYFELEPGASISLPTEMAVMMENDLGRDINAPASVGDQIITPDYSLVVNEQIRGVEAEALLQNNNPYYTAPSQGFETLLLRIDLQYISETDLPVNISSYSFYAVDSSGFMLASGIVYTPTGADWISATFLPGADLNGWVAVTVPEGSSPIIVAFDPDRSNYNSTEQNLRFFKIE